MPFPARDPALDELSMLIWLSRAFFPMPALIARNARSNDVFLAITPTLNASGKMLCRTLKPFRLFGCDANFVGETNSSNVII
jgi:hypothetical protein